MAELLSRKGKQAVTVTMTGFQETAEWMTQQADAMEKTYALVYAREIATVCKAEQAQRIRRSGRSGGDPKWGKPAWKALKIKKLSKKAKSKHGHIGYRVGLFGGGWEGRGAMLERGTTKSRAYPWAIPARRAVESRLGQIGVAGIRRKLEREAKKLAAITKAKAKI